MAFIIKLSGDYGSNYYGPFDSRQEAEDFARLNLAAESASIDARGDVSIEFPNAYGGPPFRHSIGRIIEVRKDNFKTPHIKDGH